MNNLGRASRYANSHFRRFGWKSLAISIHISEDKTGALVSVDDHGAPTPREKTHEERSYGNLNRQDHGHHIPSYYTFKYCLEIMGKNHILIIFLVGVMF